MVLPTLILALVAAPQYQWPTLRQELEKHDVRPETIEDADRRITSYAVHSDPTWFAIAYYWHQGNDLLPPELRVRTFDRRKRVWRSTVLLRDVYQGGSATGIARRRGWIFIDTHISPSAGALVVLSSDLRFKKRLYGWRSLLLPDGRVVYEDSMVHFAPFHAGSVSLYDPSTDKDLRLHPRAKDKDLTTSPLNRSIVRVEQSGTSRIRIVVHEQRLKWIDNVATAPAAPEVAYTVDCVLTSTPRCTAGPRRAVDK